MGLLGFSIGPGSAPWFWSLITFYNHYEGTFLTLLSVSFFFFFHINRETAPLSQLSSLLKVENNTEWFSSQMLTHYWISDLIPCIFTPPSTLKRTPQKVLVKWCSRAWHSFTFKLWNTFTLFSEQSLSWCPGDCKSETQYWDLCRYDCAYSIPNSI